MKYLKKYILINLIITLYSIGVIAAENKILFKVNNEIITTIDIATEINYLNIINQDYKRLDRKKAIEIAKNSIVREKIKKIELSRVLKETKVNDELLNNFILNYYRELGINSIMEFDNFFINKGIEPNLVKNKITIEILWNQMIYKKFRKNIKIDKKLITQELLKNNKQKEYLLSEILFNINNNENFNDKLNTIKKEIIEKNFSQAALSYSISETSNKGGKLGWVKESVLNIKIKNILNNTKIGNFTDPIVIPGGFLILKIEDKREIDKKINLDEAIKQIVDQKINKQLDQSSNIYLNKIKKSIIINEL